MQPVGRSPEKNVQFEVDQDTFLGTGKQQRSQDDLQYRSSSRLLGYREELQPCNVSPRYVDHGTIISTGRVVTRGLGGSTVKYDGWLVD